MTKHNDKNLYGYIEGYYGKLLGWDDRAQLLATLHNLGMNSYLYAPKEDPLHRFEWRKPYPSDWRRGFAEFTHKASTLGINVIAGLAPGLDFNFGHINGGADCTALMAKAHQLVKDGAHAICLLMDDLDAHFQNRAGGFTCEGAAHAELANIIAAELDLPVYVTPRIYADEITDGAAGYLKAFANNLDARVDVFICGKHIVAHDLNLMDGDAVAAGIAPERLIIWDNYYANDYCPRRLYLGPWRSNGLSSKNKGIMLNPTGQLATDQLLLAIMRHGHNGEGWRNVLIDHGVPLAFFAVANAFNKPPHPDGNDAPINLGDPTAALTALDEMLWQWKSPLSRELYPFLMGLRHDILLTTGQMDDCRRDKIMPPLLTNHYKNLY